MKANHHLTELLLGIIEDSAMYKVALGFDKGDVGAVSSNTNLSRASSLSRLMIHHGVIRKKK